MTHLGPRTVTKYDWRSTKTIDPNERTTKNRLKLIEKWENFNDGARPRNVFQLTLFESLSFSFRSNLNYSTTLKEKKWQTVRRRRIQINSLFFNFDRYDWWYCPIVITKQTRNWSIYASIRSKNSNVNNKNLLVKSWNQTVDFSSG